MTGLRRPDGSPSGPDDLVGSSGSAPASIDPVKNLAPWPAPDESRVRGPLAWSDDELAAVVRDNNITFPGPTPESEAEAELFAAIKRAKPGRIRGKLLARAGDRDLASNCLIKAHGNAATAMGYFTDEVKSGMSKKALKNGSADTTATNRWYAATEFMGALAARGKNSFSI